MRASIRRLRTKVAHRYHGGGKPTFIIHDSSLLADGIRVLTRGLQRISACETGALKVVDHQRAAKRRVLEICRAAKTLSEAGRENSKRATANHCADAWLDPADGQVLDQLKAGKLVAQAGTLATVSQPSRQLRHFLPLNRKSDRSAQARIFEGQHVTPIKS